MADEVEKFVFAKIDVGILAHKTTAKLLSRKGGEGAFAVYVAAICWCRDQMSDGVLPLDIARTLLFGAGARHLELLVEVGWLLRRPDGDFDVWNYAKKNDTRASVEERRARDRKRKQTARMSDRNPDGLRADSERSHTSFPACASASASDLDLEGVQGGPCESGIRPAARLEVIPPARTDIGGIEPEVWAEGVSQGTTAPCSPPRGAEVTAIRDALAAHCPQGLDASARVAWLRAAACDYAIAQAGTKLTGWAFASWLNSTRPTRAASRASPSRAPTQPLAPARARPAFGVLEAIAEGERQRKAGEI